MITGTAIAQAMPIAISPILTRLYSPSEFGIFSLFISISAIINVIASGRYELAIMLPKSDEDAINITSLSIIIVTAFSFFSLLLIYFFNDWFSELFGNDEIGIWLFFLPLSMFFTGLYQSMNYWFNRKKQFKRISISRVSVSSTTAITNVGVGYFGGSGLGLILGTLFGQIYGSFVFVRFFYKSNELPLRRITRTKMYFLAKKYKDFPLYDAPASLLNISSQYITNILITKSYNAISSGYYFFAFRLMNAPMALLATAVQDVFKEQASRDFSELGNAKEVFISTFKKLCLLALAPCIVIFLFAPYIFGFIFGEEWREAGVYAQIMSPMLFFRFVASPLSFMFYIGGKQRLNLIGNLILLVFCLGSFAAASSVRDTIIYITVSFSFVYIGYLFVSAKIAKVL